MVYYFCHCMSLHVCSGDFFFYFCYSQFTNYFGKKLSFWLSACSILIVVPLLLVRSSFPLVSWTEGVRYLYRFRSLPYFLFILYFELIAISIKCSH